MTYRDELGQAHEKIARLEAELQGRPRAKRSYQVPIILGLVFGVAVFMSVGLVVAVRVRAPRPANVVRIYDVDNVIPTGTFVLVRGHVVHDSVLRGPNCETSFQLARGRAMLAVHTTVCNLPETLGREGF